MPILQVIIFILYVICAFLIPGLFLLEWSVLPLKGMVRIGLAFTVGISAYLLVTLLIRLVQFPFWVLYFYICGGTFWFSRKVKGKDIRVFFKQPVTRRQIAALTTFGVISLSLVVVHLASGFTTSGGLSASRDSLWRIAISTELLHHFPPQIPGFTPQLLKNYHFFYDLLIASSSALTGIGIVDLYFHYFSLLVAVLFCLMMYVGCREFTKSNTIAFIGGMVGVMTGNISYILPLISRSYDFIAKADVFLSDQPFDQSYNPFNLLAYALFIGCFILFYHWEKKMSRRTYLLVTLSVMVLPLVKVYAGALILGGLLLASFFHMLKEKRLVWEMIMPFLATWPLMQVMRGNNFSILAWNPGWVLTKMVQDSDRLNIPDWILKEQYYQSVGNIPRLIQLKLTEFLIYLIGNINVRIIAFAAFVMKSVRDRIPPSSRMFIIIVTGAAFGMPILFSQNRAVYDSIQFTPYGLILLSIISVVVFDGWYLGTKKLLTKRWLLLLGISLIIIAIPTNVYLVFANLLPLQFEILPQEAFALKYIRDHADPNAIILNDLVDNDKVKYMYVPVISERRAFLTGLSLIEQTGIDTKVRTEEVTEFFTDPRQDEETKKKKLDFLKQNQINYIYISKAGMQYQKAMEELGLPLFYKNGQAAIYQVL